MKKLSGFLRRAFEELMLALASVFSFGQRLSLSVLSQGSRAMKRSWPAVLGFVFTSCVMLASEPPQVRSMVTIGTQCNGFIAAKGIVVTAGHCLHGVKKSSQIEIGFHDGQKVYFSVQSVMFTPGGPDYGILKGDTKNYPPLPLAAKAPIKGERFIAYPMKGNQVVREKWEKRVTLRFVFFEGFRPLPAIPYEEYVFAGSPFYGASGSPVINEDTGQVVGVISSGWPIIRPGSPIEWWPICMVTPVLAFRDLIVREEK